MARIGTQDPILLASEVARAELAPGEGLVWADRPAPSVLAAREMPKALLVTAVIVVMGIWALNDYRSHEPMATVVIHGVIAAASIGAALSPLWAMIRARSTVYAITNQRILIIKRGWFLRTASYAPADVQEIKRFNRDDGCGDVTFRVEWVGSGEDREKREIGFFGVDNAQRVEDLVRGIAQKNGELLAS